MDAKTWREVADVTARTTVYLLQKMSRDQERFLKAGKRPVHMHPQDELEGRSEDLSAHKPPLCPQEDFGENPSGKPCQGTGKTRKQLGTRSSQMANCGNNLKACSEEMAGMVS